MNFNELNLQENLKKAIDEMGFVELTPVQEEAYKIIMEDRDVLAQSQTGTGKTAAFLVPIMQLFLTNEKFKGGKALVVVPTRELAVQVEKEAKKLNAYLDFNVLAVYGGVGYQKQEEELEKGVDFIIATPGRLIDFKKSGKIDLKEISAVVIDEADRLFDMGFLPDLTYILKAMVPPTERRTMLFSATLGTRVGNLSWEFMNEPGEIIIEPEHVTIDLVKQELYHVSREEKMSLLLGLLKKHNPKSGLIFTNTKGMAYEVSQRLEENGYKARYLIGDMPQSKRNAVMESMKRGEIPFLVATDVAARGLHINDLEMVFNYDLPDEAESYVHRIGRTGRAGKEGHAISLACETFVLGLPAIESYIEMKIPVVWADDEVFVEDASAGKRYRLDDMRGGGRGGRDGRRDNRTGGQRGQRGGRDNRRDNRDGGQRGRDNRGNQRGGRGSGPQHRDDSRAASVVDMAAGSIDAFGKDGNKKSASPQQRGGQGRRDNRGGDRGGQRGGERGGQGRNNRNYQKGRGRRPDSRNFDGESSISGDLSVEDRLAYYKRKYGDDFKPTDEMLKKDKVARKKSGKKGGKSPQGNNRGGQRGKGKNAPKGQSKGKSSVNKAPRDGQRNNQKPAAKAPEKKSFIKKLFGKK